ncbi:MAG TPA: hypothetical protein VGK54_16075, partial [Chloroflexota bacterium]
MATASPVHLRMLFPPGPWTRALDEGAVDEPGITYDSRSDIELAPERFIVAAEGGFDVGENGVRRAALDLQAGKSANGIPVFFGREHMQRNFFVRADSPMRSLGDLAGKRVGSRLSAQSGTGGAVLMMLEVGYGIDLHSIEWRCGLGLDWPVNRMGLDLRPGPETEDELFDAVLSGRLHAGFITGGPRYWSMFGGDKLDEEVKAHPGIRILENDPAALADQFKRTGLYPISDIVTLKPELAQQHPDLPNRLVSLLSKANAMASRYRPPEEQQLAEQEIELLGTDAHQYGLTDGNRANLAAFLDF